VDFNSLTRKTPAQLRAERKALREDRIAARKKLREEHRG